MTSSTDQYIITHEYGGRALPAGGDSMCLENAQTTLADKRRYQPSATYGLARMIVCDDSGTPVPGRDDDEAGLRPPTGRLGGSNGPSGTGAGTPDGTLTASRDQHGDIVVGVKPTRIFIGADVPPAEIQKWRSEASSPYLRAAYGAALALLSREEADAKAKTEAAEAAPLEVHRDQKGDIVVSDRRTPIRVFRSYLSRDDIQQWHDGVTLKDLRAAAIAAIAFLDREEAEKARPQGITLTGDMGEPSAAWENTQGREIVIPESGVWTLGKTTPAPAPGVWVTAGYNNEIEGSEQYYEIRVHPTKLAALEYANGFRHLRAIHVPYGKTLEEATNA